ncbi:MAG: AsmA family protein [Gammaproteobacteria bacterium]|nr:AsmA family protein [Gammaproteobacteria bacterium]
MLVILWIVGALVAIAVLAMFLVPMFIDEQALLDLAQEQVQTQAGGELIVEGDAELSFFPRFGLRLEETTLNLPAQTEYDQDINATITELDVGLSLLPLLGGNIDIGTIVIAGVTADITEPQALPPAPEPRPIMSDREWEKRGEIIRLTKEQERQRQLNEDGGVSGIAILAEAIQIEDITVIQRTRDGELSNEIRIAALKLTDVNTRNEPMQLEGALTVLGDGSTAPLDIALDGAIRIASDFSKIEIQDLQTEVIGALTKPVESALNGTFVMTPAKADFTLSASLPGGDVTGQLVWSALETPEIKLDINTARLDADQIQPAPPPVTAATGSAPATEPPPAPVGSEAGNSAPVPLPVGPLRDLDLEMRVAADELIAGGQTISDAQVFMRVLDGVANIDYIRGVLHQGQLDTRVMLNARRPVVEAEVEGGLKGVNMDLLLASMGNTDAASGRIEMGWDLETEGVTADDLMAALDGDVTANGQDLMLQKVSVQGLVCNAVAIVNKIPPISGLPTNTPVTDLSLAVDFDDGLGDIEKLRFSTPGVVMKGSGDIDLSSMDFGFRMEGQVNNEITEVSPLCVIDQRYAGVDWPVDCAGNLASESGAACKVDVATIAEQILKNEAQQQMQDTIEEKAGSFIKKLFGD